MKKPLFYFLALLVLAALIAGGLALRQKRLGVTLLFLSLTVTFRSSLRPVSIMATLPLSLIGAAWATLLSWSQANSAACPPSWG
jgi:multidrug efflux pump subunit AcrB